MSNQKFESYWNQYITTESEQEQWDMTKAFLLSSSLPKLMEWNNFLRIKSDAYWRKINEDGGLSEPERQALLVIHDKCADLMDRILKERDTRKAAKPPQYIYVKK
jgi:hypothetical protein